MATAVEAAILEIQAAIDESGPAHEGLRDYNSLDLLDEARNLVQQRITEFDRRVRLLRAALDACNALMDDGYPGLEILPIPESAYQDLLANAATIQAALARFESQGQATDLGLTAGEAEPK